MAFPAVERDSPEHLAGRNETPGLNHRQKEQDVVHLRSDHA